MNTDKTTKTTRIAVRTLAFVLSMIAGYFLANQLNAQTPSPNTTLWKISGNDLEKPSYLFGTYHLLRDGFLPSDGAVQKAFSQADGVVVEMEMDSSQLGMVMGYSIMQDNLLSKLLEKKEYSLVEQEVKSLTGQSLASMDQLKPISLMLFMTLTFTNQVAPELAQYEGEPLDQYFVNAGRNNGKAIHTFETMLEQMELLYNGTSLEEQADQLVEFVQEKQDVLDYSKELVQLYMDGKINEMQAISQKWGDSFGGMEALVDDRNTNWMKQLPGLMEEGSQFVAVGALHLPGDKGLINLLKKQGYTLTPVH